MKGSRFWTRLLAIRTDLSVYRKYAHQAVFKLQISSPSLPKLGVVRTLKHRAVIKQENRVREHQTGEPGRALKTRIDEHKKIIRDHTYSSAISEHVKNSEQTVKWDSVKIIDGESNDYSHKLRGHIDQSKEATTYMTGYSTVLPPSGRGRTSVWWSLPSRADDSLKILLLV